MINNIIFNSFPVINANCMNITDLSIKHETLTRCCFEIGQLSTTLAQHQNRIG